MHRYRTSYLEILIVSTSKMMYICTSRSPTKLCVTIRDESLCEARLGLPNNPDPTGWVCCLEADRLRFWGRGRGSTIANAGPTLVKPKLVDLASKAV